MSKSADLITKLRRIMNSKFKIVLGVLAGAALGVAAVQGLHAQAKPKAYIVTESEVLDAAALAAYVPQAQAAARAAGGRPGVVPAGGKIVALVGEPPKRFGASWMAHFRGRHIDESLTSLTPSYCRAGSTAEPKT